MNIDARKEAFRIVIEMLSEACNGDGLPIASLEPDMAREVTNAVIDIADGLWNEYHELSWQDAMKLFDKFPTYKE